MRITAECTMTIDNQRKVWTSASGDVDATDANAMHAMSMLAHAAASAAQQAYDHATARLHGEPTASDPPRPPAQVE